VINTVLEASSQAVKDAIPPRNSLHQIVNRARALTAQRPPVAPVTLTGWTVPDQYTRFQASNGQDELFLLCDSGIDDPERQGNVT